MVICAVLDTSNVKTITETQFNFKLIIRVTNLYLTDRIKLDMKLMVNISHAGLLDKRKERKCFLFNDALNTFYLRLYGIRHMVKNHSDRERGNPLPPHMLLFPINSKGSFICIIPQRG